MGFKSVYRTLVELFPQVDARILKAVAIEHPKDPNGAVESILTEVLPWVMKESGASPSQRKILDGKSSSETVQYERKIPAEMAATTISSFSKLGSVAGEDENGSRAVNDFHHGEPRCLNKTLGDSLGSAFHDAKDNDDQLILRGSEELTSSESLEERDGIRQESLHITSVTSICEESDNHDHDLEIGNNESEEFDASKKYQEMGDDLNFDDISYASSLTSSIVKDSSADACLGNDKASLCIKEHILAALGSNIVPEAQQGVPVSDSDYPESKVCGDSELMKGICVHDMVDADLSTGNAIITRSDQICRIDLLEEIIEDAKNHKETLITAMDSVIGLMREVELQEKALEQAKEAAARGGLEIQCRVEELKKMLIHAKEANDMHAGEVNGEKAILATEMRELQSRLLFLSDERDKALLVVDKMRQTLEVRLAAAEEERRAAEKEKVEKEESAQRYLSEQELIMEKLVQESKVLQQEAEENAKLRDFLMDRGHVVDVLQGEISVICQDVKLMKEKFDNGIPLSRSLTSYQSSCSLASASSSHSTVASDQVPADSSKVPEWVAVTSSGDLPTPKSSFGEGKIAARKELQDDDWDFFEDSAE
ncbi:hypothetical protein Nepgr_029652 [Nepenthes gracilis]|uniref:CUE domain-containing protein n=1 Tax=Nepenthes gracilis TaxID=150966 RepID=A0AAD3Y5A6_NEPGR|nr:hypothetical protein Nepgr_029652 [Nepenthes gracilis]